MFRLPASHPQLSRKRQLRVYQQVPVPILHNLLRVAGVVF